MAVCVIICETGEAAALSRWARRFAVARGEPIFVIDAASPNQGKRGVEEIATGRVADHAVLFSARDAMSPQRETERGAIEERYFSAPGRSRRSAVLKFVEEAGVRLLVVGKQSIFKSPDGGTHIGRDLYETAPCATMLFRLGGSDGTECDLILVPCSGGPHSRAALRLADRVSQDSGAVYTPLYIEPNIDAHDVAQEVGRHLLNDILANCGIDRESAGEKIQPRVVVSDDISAGIAEGVTGADYDLVIVGATGVGTIRRKLFGTIPQRLMSHDGNLAVAVMRRERALSVVLREKVERWLHLRIPQLARTDRVALFEKLQDGSHWSFDFMVLICLSTAIAALGLLQNSTAVVIGAMLVAPLMTPLLGCGLSLVQGNLPLFRSAIRAIVYGFFSALCIGFVIGLVFGGATGLTPEMAARGGPTLLDMGVAFISGVAASYCLARPKLISALAGVAIAAALVPPIATVGISLSLGETGVARGASVLFATNVLCIVLGAAVNLYAAGVRGNRGDSRGQVWAKRVIIGLVAGTLVLVIPLGSAIVSSFLEKRSAVSEDTVQVIRRVLAESTSPNIELVSVHKQEIGDNTVRLELALEGARHPDAESLKRIAEEAKKSLGAPVEAVEVVVRTTIKVRSD